MAGGEEPKEKKNHQTRKGSEKETRITSTDFANTTLHMHPVLLF